MRKIAVVFGVIAILITNAVFARDAIKIENVKREEVVNVLTARLDLQRFFRSIPN